MKKAVNKPLTDKTFIKAVELCLEHDPVNGLFNVEPYGKMPDWDTSQVTDMSFAFAFAASFNGNISNWDVSNVTDMRFMFHSASDFNANISKWDVSQVIDMEYMFYLATSFNQDLSKWDVSNVTEHLLFDKYTPASTLPKLNFNPLNK